MLHDIRITLFALEGINNGLFFIAHILIGFFAIAGRQPVLVLGCEQVELFQRVQIGKFDVTGAFLVECYIEVGAMDFAGCASLTGICKHSRKIIPKFTRGAEIVKHFFDIRELFDHIVIIRPIVARPL